MKFNVIILGVLFLVMGCDEPKKNLSAEDIVNKSIKVSGGDKFKNSTIDFDFRGRHYKAIRNDGIFTLSRSFRDSLGIYRDELSNKGFQRFINNESVKVNDSMAPRYARSVNSVHYFSVLPYGLNDPAVNTFYLEEIVVKGKSYYKIKVTFNEEGGGDDFEDVFMYWINKQTYYVDYFAYSYTEANGEYGFRFREAFNERFVNGLRFVDYNNYKPLSSTTSLKEIDKLFEKGSLKLVSKIELENVSVR